MATLTIKAANWVDDFITIRYNKRAKTLIVHDYPFKLVSTIQDGCTEVYVYHKGDEAKGRDWAVLSALKFDNEPLWMAVTLHGWNVVREDENLYVAVAQVLANLL